MAETKYLVNEWFAKNTFHSHDFANVETLLALKEKQGVTISLGLPALNEEATIGNVIDVLKGALADEAPLLDEIVVFDSSSTDRTVEIARERGVPVVNHKDVLPEAGAFRGKGEALWKSLAALKGDIIVWVDTDIRNIHPRFVYGLIGPLLRRPEIVYVKGFYLRPIRVGEVLHPVGGGRVTEILARPYLNLVFPELSAFVQPLSGEYAGRRAALEQVPFATGYGVEVGLLIDLLRKFGLGALAQVDLEQRIHRNQKLDALGRMSFGILQALLVKSRETGRLAGLPRTPDDLHYVSHFGNLTTLKKIEIREEIRPPIVTIQGYHEIRKGAAPAAPPPPPPPEPRTALAIATRRPETLEDVGAADIVVGIPSFNNARTIGHVVRAVTVGLSKYFPDARAVIVNSDGGSTDGTPEIVRSTGTEDLRQILVHHPITEVPRFVSPYLGVPGKGSAFRNVFEIAERLGARACLVVDSDLRSITPEWVDLLLSPVFRQDYDYVCPYYLRHKYDGTITNTIIYPLTRALYGLKIRQPIGGDFGLSGRLAARFLEKDVWQSDVARYGIDIWMTTTAVAERFKICQAFLGAKIHDTKDPGADLSAMLVQVVGSVFGLMRKYTPVWSAVVREEPDRIPLFGFQYEPGAEPIQVNLERMIQAFRLGRQELLPIWGKALHPDNLAALSGLDAESIETFRLPDDLWARIVYDFAVAHRRKAENPEILLKSLTPLYLAKVASLVHETWLSSSRQAENRIESLCGEFWKAKPYLIERWQERETPLPLQEEEVR